MTFNRSKLNAAIVKESRPPGRDSFRPAGASLVSTISAAPSGFLEVGGPRKIIIQICIWCLTQICI